MSYTKISKLLIANRGEIACRVIRTARDLGIRTVAVYSEPDKQSLHVKMADEAHCIGPAASQLSYLKGDKILSVAKRTGAQAVHPGYGFLSESVEFADLCQQQGIIFVGPPASAIRDMGIKNTSKEIMEAAGVPIITGYHGSEQNPDFLLAEAKKIGFPVMIKAVRGGGGKGMRISLTEPEFMEQLESAKREAKKAFNNDAMLLEKYIQTPRHVEVQVFGDHHNNYVYLFERDCSVQRRHQKILEEAPAPGISPQTRQSLGEAAVKAAQAVGYVGAGTVEFIMDRDEKFYFMEMNTRLQVEHPITEMITKTDLVEWQLRVAAGEPLPLKQKDITLSGHAFEARIYAEDCSPTGFLPTAGPVHHLSTPTPSGHVRIDTGVMEGDEISVHYDPMIAKLVVWSHDRPSALQRLLASLKDYNIVGLPSNVEFLQDLGNHPEFAKANVHTDFIAQHSATLFPQRKSTALTACKAAATLVLLDRARPQQRVTSNDTRSPFESDLLAGFRLNSTLNRRIDLKIDDQEFPVVVEYLRSCQGGLRVRCQDVDEVMSGCVTHYDVTNKTIVELEVGESTTRFAVVKETEDGSLHLFEDGHHLEVSPRLPRFVTEAGGSVGSKDSGKEGCAPMPGVVERVMVTEGQDVAEGQPLVTMIAMKMEYTIRAGAAGKVTRVQVKEGQSVRKGEQMVDVEQADG